MIKTEMEQRAYHGDINVEDMARALVVQFNQGATRAQWMRGRAGRAVVQIQMRQRARQAPENALTLHLTPSETGIVVSMAEQRWLGVAADLARSGLLTLLNPWNIIGEIDDIARNVRSLQLRDEVWNAVELYCRSVGVGRGVGPSPQHILCDYCGTPNPLGSLICQACRAPLVEEQPLACARCGFLNDPDARYCVNCQAPLKA
ncbi:MAG: zinc ribbon domain-containing protein [Anaerolineae bacterium]